jgi:hypothetical protein
MARTTTRENPQARDHFAIDQPREVLPEGCSLSGVIRQGKGASAGIRILRTDDGRQAVLKDFSHRGTLFRKTAGALMARRETAAYLRLGTVRRVPRFIARVGSDGILIEYIECLPPGISPNPPSNDFFEELGAILRTFRERGVIHGDTCRNVQMDGAGKPWLMDFGASFVIRGWLAPIKSNLRRIVKKYDERDVAVLKSRIAPELLSASDREIISRQLPFQGLMALGRKLLAWVVLRVFDNHPVDGESPAAESHTIEHRPRESSAAS